MNQEVASRKKSLQRLIGLLIFCLLILPAVGWALGAFLVTSDRLQQADAVVLLAGGDDSRLQSAVSIYQQRLANMFILTETGETVGDSKITMIESTRTTLISEGVPSDAIVMVEEPSDSTYQEAETVRAVMTERGWVSAIIVTDPYHTRRTKLIYNQVLDGSGIQAIIRPAQGHWYHPSTWFLSAAGWQATILELVKLVNDGIIR